MVVEERTRISESVKDRSRENNSNGNEDEMMGSPRSERVSNESGAVYVNKGLSGCNVSKKRNRIGNCSGDEEDYENGDGNRGGDGDEDCDGVGDGGEV